MLWCGGEQNKKKKLKMEGLKDKRIDTYLTVNLASQVHHLVSIL